MRAVIAASLAVATAVALVPAQAVAAPSPAPQVPPTPRQEAGTAAGRAHSVAATATDPLAGAKSAPSTAGKRPKGSVPGYQIHQPVHKEVSTGTRVHDKPVAKTAPKITAHGFNARTSVRRGDL